MQYFTLVNVMKLFFNNLKTASKRQISLIALNPKKSPADKAKTKLKSKK